MQVGKFGIVGERQVEMDVLYIGLVVVLVIENMVVIVVYCSIFVWL